MNKLIKTESDYDKAMEKLHKLMLQNPNEGTTASDELELLAHLIELYESSVVNIPPPSPVEAIKFRMDQQGLKQKDLVPFIGSKARVSEILAGKRELTMAMARTLSKELSISAKTLLGVDYVPEEIDPNKYPLKEMHKFGYFGDISWESFKDKAEEYLQTYFKGFRASECQALNRTGFKVGANLDDAALEAWRWNVLRESEKISAPKFQEKDLTVEFINGLVILTQFESGRELVKQALLDKGVIILEEVTHFSKTYLDGAAMMNSRGNAVIGLTFRHNRLDNYWFTLFHELGHVKLHLSKSPEEVFFDDTESHDASKKERQADEFALNNLIPEKKWEKEIKHLTKAGEIRSAAKQLGICPSIIAGRLRKHNNDYRLHRTLIGSGALR